MTSITQLSCSSLFIFDLEFIGKIQDINTCKIWEIAVFSKDTGQWFEAVVDPDPTALHFPKPPVIGLPHLTRDFLQRENAVTFDIVLHRLIQWVRAQTLLVPVFISHNTFKADKPILELEASRYRTSIPLQWFFFDSLHFCRDHYKSEDGNFSLSGLNKQLFNCPIREAHRARNDVIACTAILGKITNNKWNLIGPIYSAYSTSLRTIRWVGKRAESILIQNNIRSVENLIELLKGNAFSDYINHHIHSSHSVTKTMFNIFDSKLPNENVNNIVAVIKETIFLPHLVPVAGY